MNSETKNSETKNIPFPPGDYLEPSFHFYTDVEPVEIFKKIQIFLNFLEIEYQKEEPYTLRCNCYPDHERLRFAIRLFNTPSKLLHHPNAKDYIGKFSIELQRLYGPGSDFLRIFHSLVRFLQTDNRYVRLPQNMSPMIGFKLPQMNPLVIVYKDEKSSFSEKSTVRFCEYLLYMVMNEHNSLIEEGLISLVNFIPNHPICRSIITGTFEPALVENSKITSETINHFWNFIRDILFSYEELREHSRLVLTLIYQLLNIKPSDRSEDIQAENNRKGLVKKWIKEDKELTELIKKFSENEDVVGKLSQNILSFL